MLQVWLLDIHQKPYKTTDIKEGMSKPEATNLS